MAAEKNEMFRHHTGRYHLYQEAFYRSDPSSLQESGEDESGALTTEQIEQLRYYLPRHGRTLHRALDQPNITHSAFHNPGAFGRMFPALPSVAFTDVSLENLARAMLDISGGGDNPDTPAGFTFLGQFIDHDITFDPTSSLEKQNDPEAIHNFRTPVLELDSLYGSGPATHPFLYDADPARLGKMLLGRDAGGQPEDVPRNSQGTALLGDPRNDENLIVSQLHLVFLKFHNRVLDHLRANGAEGGQAVADEFLFEETQRVVRWHYQWLVVHDFLKRIVGEETWRRLVQPQDTGEAGSLTVGQDPLGNVLDKTLKIYRWKEEPFIPVEFAVAAYRFGHSQIRPAYRINNGFQGAIFPNLATRANLGAGNVLQAGRGVDWPKFFHLGEAEPQPGKRIDSSISSPLGKLPGFATVASLPERNLKRGNAFGLPWGQAVAAALGIPPLQDGELAIKGRSLADLGFPGGRAPLWYYILKEAEVRAQGRHLGPVGGQIVGEVFLGLLKGDFKSYLNQDPLWKPFLPAAGEEDFTAADLIRFATEAIS